MIQVYFFFNKKLLIKTSIAFFIIFFLFPNGLLSSELICKYNNYRKRLLDEFVIISSNVEQFGVNIPAVDRKLDSLGNPIWISWSDGNSNYNQWLGLLATEYRLLKDNDQDYSETLKLLVYSLLSIERLDLYSEYLLRKDKNSFQIIIPKDINGFLIRDDVSLGFWRQYHPHFKIPFGELNSLQNGTNTYRSVFQKGKIPKQGMSQDNIYYMLQALALIKKLCEPESIKNIEINYINFIIPKYLSSKKIISNDSVYFDKWIDDIVNRLSKHLQQDSPSPALIYKPLKNLNKAQLYDNDVNGIISTRWYILNPVTNKFVREGSGDDMSVWLHSYGVAEATNTITGKNDYHFDKSQKGLTKYLFESILYKNFRIFKVLKIPIPKNIDDYMIRTLASVADINRENNPYELLYTLRDKRKNKTYEHNPLVLCLLHKEKYKEIYSDGEYIYEEDKEFYRNLLSLAPYNGPTTDSRVKDYHPYWTSSSRLTWPENKGRTSNYIWDFAGMDYMLLYNLYKLVFDKSNYFIDNYEYPKTDYDFTLTNKDNKLDYNHLPPQIRK